MSTQDRKYGGRVTEEESSSEVLVGGGVLFVGRGDPRQGFRMQSFDAATAFQELVLDQLNSIESWKRLGLRLEQITAGLGPFKRPALFADSTGRREQEQLLIDVVEYLESDAEAAEFAEDLCFIHDHLEDLSEESARAEVDCRIGRWADNPATGVLLEPVAASARTATAERLKQQIEIELDPAIKTALEVRPQPTVPAWVEGAKRQLAKTAEAIENDAARLRQDIELYLPVDLALASYLANAGPLGGKLHVLSVPDVHAAFVDHTPELIEAIERLQLNFVDVILAEPVSEEAASTFIRSLGTDLHGALFLPATQYANVRQLSKSAPKRKATNASGNVYMIAGKGILGGFESVPMAAAAAAIRRRTDQFIGTKSYGILEPTFARKGPKELVAFEHVDSCEWRPQAAMDLATNSGVNAFIHNPSSNVQTLALDRSRSSLEDKLQFTANRALQILLGAIREFLTVELPANYDDPETIRETLRRTNEIFLEPYARTPSFRAEITHRGSPAPGLVGLHLAYRINSPIESFLINVSSN